MAITFDTEWAVTGITSGTAIATATHTPGAGCKLVVAAIYATQSIGNIVDSLSQSWVQLPQFTTSNFLQISYLVNPAISSFTISSTLGSSGRAALAAISFNGTAGSSPFDKGPLITNGSSATPTSLTSATTSFPNEVLIGIGGSDPGSNVTETAGSGYTLDTAASNASGSTFPLFWMEYQIVAATGTYNSTLTLGSSHGWAMGIATFADTPVPGPTVDAGARWIGQSGPALNAPFNINQFAPFGFSTSIGLPLAPQSGGTGKYRRRFHRYT